MEEDKKNTFTIVNEDGVEEEFEVLFVLDSDETKKHYLVYTDNKTDENGIPNAYAYIFDPTGKDKSLIPIETDAEWKVIEDILASLPEKENQ